MADQARIDESVMATHGEYSRHSRPQHAAAAVAYPYLQSAAARVPLPDAPAPLQILDMGCAGGQNEMEPLALAIDGVRARDARTSVCVVHTDLPENDFGSLFALLGTANSYTAGRDGVFPSVVGRTLYGPLVPDRSTQLGWSGITLHWLSTVPCPVPDAVDFEVLDHREDASDDSATFPQYARDHDAAAFARAYIGFVRAVTENPFFRSLDPARTEAQRDAVITEFYDGLQQRIEAAPEVATCVWRVVSLHLRRRPRR